MTDRRTLWLASGFAAGLLLAGVPFWQLPYNADFWGNPPFVLGMAGLGLVTAALAASGIARTVHIFWIMLAAFPAAVMIRVVVETTQDPTGHNLWPFELILAAFLSLVIVVPGLLIGALVRRIRA